MTSQGTAQADSRERSATATVSTRKWRAEMGELSFPDALAFCLLLADVDPPRSTELSRAGPLASFLRSGVRRDHAAPRDVPVALAIWRLVSPLPPTSDEGDETNDEAQGRNT
jgi:hypothetical protein